MWERSKRCTQENGYTIDESDDEKCMIYNAVGTKLNSTTPKGASTSNIWGTR